MVFREMESKFLHVKRLKIIAMARRYRKLPKYNLPNALIDGFRLSGISILMAKFFTTATLGQFSLAWKMVQMPMGLIGGSLSQVFFQKVASTKKTDLHRVVVKFIIKASLGAAPIFLIIYFFAVDIFKFTFGHNWELAGQAASIMAPWLFLSFLSSPMANVFVVLNKQEVVLLVSIIYMLLPISILVFLNSMGFVEVLKIITYVMSIVLIFYILLALNYTKEARNGI
jgi:O-antigen/teichoic acid export membrane protein